MRKIVLTSAMLLFCFIAYGQSISRQEAKSKAQRFVERNMAQCSKGAGEQQTVFTSVSQQSILTNTKGDQLYIFNIGDAEGYVIVSGDERTPEILGYSDTGCIDPDNMPENMRSWLEGYAKQISMLGANAAMTTAVPTHPAVDPIVTTKWNQDAPYNNLCPMLGDERTVTGCVATSLAQILNVVRPSKVNAIPAYETKTEHIKMDALPEYSFAWDGSDEDIALLMRYCGQAVLMDYNVSSVGGSGATDYNGFNGLKKFFNISSLSCDLHQREIYTSEEWDNVIYNEIAYNHRPIYLSGANAMGGHAFVCDGYDGNGKYHINWGWSGMSDGYFVINNLTPKIQGIGGSSGGYNDECFVITGIKEKADTEECIFTVSIDKTTISNTSFSRDTETDNFNFSLSSRIINRVSWEEKFDVTYALYDGDQRKQISSDIIYVDLQNNWDDTYDKTFTLGAGLPDGTYSLVPISRQTGTTVWTLAQNHRAGEYIVEISGNTATIISAPAENSNPSYEFSNISADGNHVEGVAQQLTMTVKNTGDCNSATYVVGSIVNGSLYIFSTVTLDINPGDTQTLTTKFAIDGAGNYALNLFKKIEDNKYLLVEDLGINYEIIPEQTGSLEIEIIPTSEYVLKDGVYCFSTPEVNFKYHLTNNNATPYHSYLYLWYGLYSESTITTSGLYSTPADVEANNEAYVEYSYTIPEENVEYNLLGSYVSGYEGDARILERDQTEGHWIIVKYDPTPTGISQHLTTSDAQHTIYTLDGRRVNASTPLHGIYIKDGKKIIKR